MTKDENPFDEASVMEIGQESYTWLAMFLQVVLSVAAIILSIHLAI